MIDRGDRIRRTRNPLPAWLLTAALLAAGCAPPPGGENRGRPPDPNAFDIQMYKARAYQERNNPEMALQALLEARRLEPTNVEVTIQLGRIYDMMGRKEQALLALEQAVAIRPGDAVLTHDYGVALFKMGRLDEAAAVFLKVLKDPAFPTPEDAYYNLALVVKQQGDEPGMVEKLHAALRVNPTHVLSHEALANHFVGLGRQEEARRHWLAALDARQNDPALLEKVAETYLREHRMEEARTLWQRIVATAPSTEYARRAHAQLALTGSTPDGMMETPGEAR
ncbi:MAG: tetratricopeptide repeat protein [Magnetococcales bacterium]|nr:tetratricopeptide repeat protein [Magnetococcales bacterium]